jgi:hypothetical protein
MVSTYIGRLFSRQAQAGCADAHGKLASWNCGQRIGDGYIERAQSSADLKCWQTTHASVWYAEVRGIALVVVVVGAAKNLAD